MCELLVKARRHPDDSLDAATINRMTPEQKEDFDARPQVGDIVVVKPDGWEWGKAERLPGFVVIKLPGIPFEQAREYEDVAYKTVSMPDGSIRRKRLFCRKWRISRSFVGTMILQGKSEVTIENMQQKTFLRNQAERKV